jgi:diadenosine tetraphosphate (Ap4A) HIT family hydrolase
MSSTSCVICQWIDQIKQGTHPGFVKELKTGYVILNEFQYFRGYSLFLSKTHAAELHELSASERSTFLAEMSLVGEAVYRAFQPKKLNYELLGNLSPHMHWHIIPRYKTDSQPEKSVWELNKEETCNPEHKSNPEDLAKLREILFSALTRLV